MVIKQYSPAEYEFVFQWANKWLELIKLINETTGTDEPPWSPPVPTDLEELHYQQLRFWFIDHQAQFVPLWEDFYECQEWASHQNLNNEDIADLSDIDKYLENPFFFFYKPENLFQLAQQLALQSGIDIWEPSEQRAGMIRPMMIGMGRRMIEFKDWVDGRTFEPK
ncbi:hypothetical protein ACFLUX_00275 [Chloroflexota bacterium]